MRQLRALMMWVHRGRGSTHHPRRDHPHLHMHHLDELGKLSQFVDQVDRQSLALRGDQSAESNRITGV